MDDLGPTHVNFEYLTYHFLVDFQRFLGKPLYLGDDFKLSTAVNEMRVLRQGDADCVVITPFLDLQELNTRNCFRNRYFLIEPFSQTEQADDLMGRIVGRMSGSRALDQRALHRDLSSYRVVFHHVPRGGLPGIFGDFELKDYLFSDRSMSDVKDFDGFMRALDRNRMSQTMVNAFVDRFEMSSGEDQSWRKAFLDCCHPDASQARPVRNRFSALAAS